MSKKILHFSVVMSPLRGLCALLAIPWVIQALRQAHPGENPMSFRASIQCSTLPQPPCQHRKGPMCFPHKQDAHKDESTQQTAPLGVCPMSPSGLLLA